MGQRRNDSAHWLFCANCVDCFFCHPFWRFVLWDVVMNTFWWSAFPTDFSGYNLEFSSWLFLLNDVKFFGDKFEYKIAQTFDTSKMICNFAPKKRTFNILKYSSRDLSNPKEILFAEKCWFCYLFIWWFIFLSLSVLLSLRVAFGFGKELSFPLKSGITIIQQCLICSPSIEEQQKQLCKFVGRKEFFAIRCVFVET